MFAFIKNLYVRFRNFCASQIAKSTLAIKKLQKQAKVQPTFVNKAKVVFAFVGQFIAFFIGGQIIGAVITFVCSLILTPALAAVVSLVLLLAFISDVFDTARVFLAMANLTSYIGNLAGMEAAV